MASGSNKLTAGSIVKAVEPTEDVGEGTLKVENEKKENNENDKTLAPADTKVTPGPETTVPPHTKESNPPSLNDKKASKPTEPVEVRGRPISGRVWKVPQTKQQRTIATKKSLKKKTFAQRQEERRQRKELVETVKELKRKRDEEVQEERELRKAKRRRKEQNELKSSSYQVITNKKKLAKLSKAQLQRLKRISSSDRNTFY